jgi:signal recognition particle subunit SRP54
MERDLDLNDFRNQFEQFPEEHTPQSEDILRIRRMIGAMTEDERADPDIIDATRRERIAEDAGVEPIEVERFLLQFNQARLLFRQTARMSWWRRILSMFGIGRIPPSES